MFWICYRSKQQQMYVWRMTSNGTVLRLNDGHPSVSPVTSKFIWNCVRDYLKLFLEKISGGSVVQYPKGVDVVYFSFHYPLVFFFFRSHILGRWWREWGDYPSHTHVCAFEYNKTAKSVFVLSNWASSPCKLWLEVQKRVASHCKLQADAKCQNM